MVSVSCRDESDSSNSNSILQTLLPRVEKEKGVWGMSAEINNSTYISQITSIVFVVGR